MKNLASKNYSGYARIINDTLADQAMLCVFDLMFENPDTSSLAHCHRHIDRKPDLGRVERR